MCCVCCRQNNGTFEFFIPGSNCSDPSGNLNVVDWQDKACTKPGQFSLPAAPSATQLFTAIMRNASRWGGVTYEQDWLDFESDEVVAKHMDVAAGGDWMAALGAGAEAAGLGVQLCMSHTRHVLAAARLRHVTQTRASNDYKEMGSDQWDIGRSSLFADALGLAPAKDSYWSSNAQQQPPDGACCGAGCGKCGGPSTGRRDFYSRLNSAVSTLSTGPVAYSDRLGSEDRTAILRSCMANGTLLQPSRAATAIDATFHGMAFPEAAAAAPQGVVMATVSRNAPQQVEHGLVLSANLAAAYSFPLSAVFRDDDTVRQPSTDTYAVFESNLTRHANSSAVRTVPSTGALLLPVSDKVNFTVISLAPVTSSGWALLGELSKWVPVAEARFGNVTAAGGELEVEVVGSEGETVEISFWKAGHDIVTVTCTLGVSARARVSTASASCAQM